MVVNKMHNRDDIYVADLQQSGTRLNSPQRLTVSDSLDYPTAWTHDSTSVIFQSNRAGRNQIFRQPLSSDTAELLVQGADDEVGAEPTPDGAWILYWANSNPGREPSSTAIRLMRFPAAGGSPTQVLEVPNWANSIEPNNVEFDCPSSPGKSCVLARSEQEQLLFFALDPVRGQGREIGRTKVGSSLQTYWSLSPDGAVIGVANPVRLPEKIRILDLHSAAERDIQLPHGWRIWSLCWAADGKGLFATVSQSGSYLLVRVDLDGQTHVLLDRGRSNWISFVTTSPDGRHLAFCQQIFESNAWLWEGF